MPIERSSCKAHSQILYNTPTHAEYAHLSLSLSLIMGHQQKVELAASHAATRVVLWATLMPMLLMQLLDSMGAGVGIAVVQGMEPHFYDKTCPSAEPTIYSMVRRAYQSDTSIAPNLIRLLLHDCFVRGCDASILLKSISGELAERDAAPNLSLTKSFNLIDQIKEAMEQKCPQTVSCADIIAIASRDAVHLVGGQYFELLLGRHDGMVSSASEALRMLPDLHDSLPQALQAFQAKGFTEEEFLTLLGAHSVGTTRCSFVEGRLFNYEGTGKADPQMRPGLVEELKRQCSQPDKRVPLDQGTHLQLDNSYYEQVMEGRGVLGVDQELYSSTSSSISKHLVERFSRHNFYFQTFFQHSFKKLGLLDVLTHTGETRIKCYETNA